MSEKLILHLLILCGIWFLGITGTFGNEEIKKSSNFLLRQKRVVSYLPGEDIPVRMIHSPYVVRIRQKSRTICAGSILALKVVISSATCIPSHPPEIFDVVAASAHTTKNGNIHNVTDIRRRIDISHARNEDDGIALIIVTSPFVYSPHCQPIGLHVGSVLVGSFGKVYGWGYNFRNENKGTSYPTVLRSIEVPVMLHQNCINRYRPHLEISEKTICTFHSQRHSGHIDYGAGLVIDNTLAGVFLWSGVYGEINPAYPDVFASLQDPYYSQWIRLNLESIDLRFH